MNGPDIVRAWKDEEYRTGLTDAQRASLPGNPAGLAEMSAADLENVAGGNIGTISVRHPVAFLDCAHACYSAGPRRRKQS
jgi:mersacidin/lichenicidin family type 2 lantibiotic